MREHSVPEMVAAPHGQRGRLDQDIRQELRIHSASDRAWQVCQLKAALEALEAAALDVIGC